MNPVRRLLRQGSVYTFGSLLQLSAAAIAVPAITRLLDPAQYGLVALAFAFQAVLGTVVSFGLPAAITRRYFEGGGGAAAGREDARRLIVSAAAIAAVATALVSVSVAFWGEALVQGQVLVLTLGVCLAFPAAVLGSAQALLQVDGRAWSFVAVALLGTLGAQACGVAALILVSREPEVYLAGCLVAMLIAAGLASVLSGATHTRPASRKLLSEALRLGGPTVPHLLGVFVIALGDRVVIQAVDGAASVGRYQLAYAIGALALTLLVAFQNAWLTATFGSGGSDRWPVLAQTTTLVVRLAALLAGALALAAPLGLFLLAPSSYDGSDLVPVTALIAAAALPFAVYLPQIQVLLWEKQTKPLLWIAPSAALINLGLVVALVPMFGLEGAAVATLVAIGIQAVLAARAASAVASVPWDRAGVSRALAFGSAIIGAAILIPDGVTGAIVRGILVIAAGFLVVRTVRAAAETVALEAPSRSEGSPGD